MRVLHSTDVYLPVSQNWIYPQVTLVPGAVTRVICKAVTNRSEFAIDDSRLCNRNACWPATNRIAHLANKMLRRIGLSDALAKQWVNRWEPELIHSHFGTRGWEDLSLKKQTGARLVTSFYGVDAWSLPKMDPIWLQRYKELFREGDLFLVEGPAMRQRLVDLGCLSEKIRILRIGVDPAGLSFQPRIFTNELKIMMLGRFVEKKGLPDGLLACAIARAAGARLRITIIGDASEDDAKGQGIKRELIAIAAKSELANCVQFAGFVPLKQAYALLREQDVFLCPSKHSLDGDAEGGSPVVLTEAMAMGLLCIGTRHCDIPEVIIDGKTGLLCDEGDVAGLAAVLKSLARSPAKMVEMTDAGRRHVEKLFNLPLQMKEIAKAYQSLLQPPTAGNGNT